MVSNPLRPPRGFTLIELVTTMLIVGIIAVYAIGRLDFTSAFTQRAARDKLLAGLQFAAKAAIAERRYVCVSVNNVTNIITFTLDTRTPETLATLTPCDGSSSVNLPLPSPDKSCVGGANYTICGAGTAAPAAFEFDAQGRALVNGSTSTTTGVTFTIQPTNISVVGDTGYVH